MHADHPFKTEASTKPSVMGWLADVARRGRPSDGEDVDAFAAVPFEPEPRARA